MFKISSSLNDVFESKLLNHYFELEIEVQKTYNKCLINKRGFYEFKVILIELKNVVI